MKAILLEISFFEAFFKVHYTRKYRLSYPIPLPTTIAGMLGSLSGIPRNRIKDYFKDVYVGAKYLNCNLVFENTTLIELSKDGHAVRSVEKMLLLNEPTYVIAIGGDEKKIKEIEDRLKNYEFVFLPFGGQNDFFIKNIKFLGEGKFKESNVIFGYFPQRLLVKTTGKFWILPVKYKRDSESEFIKELFVFTEKEAEIKESILTIENIAVYKLENFSYEIS